MQSVVMVGKVGDKYLAVDVEGIKNKTSEIPWKLVDTIAEADNDPGWIGEDYNNIMAATVYKHFDGAGISFHSLNEEELKEWNDAHPATIPVS